MKLLFVLCVLCLWWSSVNISAVLPTILVWSECFLEGLQIQLALTNPLLCIWKSETTQNTQCSEDPWGSFPGCCHYFDLAVFPKANGIGSVKNASQAVEDLVLPVLPWGRGGGVLRLCLAGAESSSLHIQFSVRAMFHVVRLPWGFT